MVVKFGGFEVDLLSGAVRKGGISHGRLQDQPLKVLAMLTEQPGELVTRDSMRDRLWPENVHVDYEHGIAKAVLKLRTILGDSAESPRFIETIPRRGYRFLADVHCVAEEAPSRVRRSATHWSSGGDQREAPESEREETFDGLDSTQKPEGRNNRSPTTVRITRSRKQSERASLLSGVGGRLDVVARVGPSPATTSRAHDLQRGPWVP